MGTRVRLENGWTFHLSAAIYKSHLSNFHGGAWLFPCLSHGRHNGSPLKLPWVWQGGNRITHTLNHFSTPFNLDIHIVNTRRDERMLTTVPGQPMIIDLPEDHSAGKTGTVLPFCGAGASGSGGLLEGETGGSNPPCKALALRVLQ